MNGTVSTRAKRDIENGEWWDPNLPFLNCIFTISGSTKWTRTRMDLFRRKNSIMTSLEDTRLNTWFQRTRFVIVICNKKKICSKKEICIFSLYSGKKVLQKSKSTKISNRIKINHKWSSSFLALLSGKDNCKKYIGQHSNIVVVFTTVFLQMSEDRIFFAFIVYCIKEE